MNTPVVTATNPPLQREIWGVQAWVNHVVLTNVLGFDQHPGVMFDDVDVGSG